MVAAAELVKGGTSTSSKRLLPAMAPDRSRVRRDGRGLAEASCGGEIDTYLHNAVAQVASGR